jgi:hypothetical protein
VSGQYSEGTFVRRKTPRYLEERAQQAEPQCQSPTGLRATSVSMQFPGGFRNAASVAAEASYRPSFAILKTICLQDRCGSRRARAIHGRALAHIDRDVTGGSLSLPAHHGATNRQKKYERSRLLRTLP